MVFRIRKMVSFELSKEIGKDVFRLETNIRPSDSALRCSFSWGFSFFFVPRS